MSIKLAWGSQNNTADAVTIYRSLTTIDLANLPTPLATLPGTAVEFVDATAARNTVYNYVIAITKGADTVLSQNKLYGHFPDTGPGPANLLRGTWESGYFGTLTQTEFYPSAELVAAIGVTSTPNNSVAQIWHKFILDGKILFIPQYSITANASPLTVYQAGAAYGSDDFGDHPWPGKGILNTVGYTQNKTVTRSGYTFKVRLPKGATTPTNVPVSQTWDDTISNSEWFRTMGRIFLNPRQTVFSNSRFDDVLFVATATYGGHAGTFTQHYYSASNGYPLLLGNTAAFDSWTVNFNYNAGGYYWRPVLELIL